MNAKVKLIAAIAAVLLIVATSFAQRRGNPSSPLTTTHPIYQITGRVTQVNSDTIVIRARNPDRGNFVVYYFHDTKFTSPISVGDTVTIDYKMAAVSITPTR